MIRLIKASHDIYNRNKAILYLDGVYVDDIIYQVTNFKVV